MKESVRFFRRVEEIDILRAIAVLGVVAGHGFGLKGGFIGVDIFFVISGYVITLLMLRQCLENNFSLAGFYFHRIARIIPTLLVVSTFTYLTARYLFLVPEDFDFIRKSFLYQSFFAQNFYFSIQASDYFQGITSAKLTLHTWSLAVEEQFYIVYPLLFLLGYRFRKNALVVIIVVAIFAAAFLPAVFSYNEKIAPYVTKLLQIDFNNKTVWATRYYLILMRAWQLLIGVAGCLFAYWLYRAHKLSGEKFPKQLIQTVILTGIAAILLAMVYTHEGVPWPSRYSAIPVFATVGLLIVVHLAGQGSVPAWINNQPLRYLGRSSYSLYLWHWPVLGILVYANSDFGSSHWDYVVYIAATSALTFLTYTFIESKRHYIGRKSGAMILAAFVGFSLYAAFSNRSLTDYPKEVQAIIETGKYDGPCESCVKTPTGPFLILWGDSHSQMMVNTLERVARNKALQLVHIRGHLNGDNSVLLKMSGMPGYYGLIMASRWSVFAIGFPHDDPEEKGARYMELDGKMPTNPEEGKHTFNVFFKRLLDKLPNKPIYILAEVPRYPFLPVKEAVMDWAGLKLRPLQPKKLEVHQAEQSEISAIFSQLSNSYPNVDIVDPSITLCPNGQCIWRHGFEIWYKDDDHLSVSGAGKLVPLFSDVIKSSVSPVITAKNRVRDQFLLVFPANFQPCSIPAN